MTRRRNITGNGQVTKLRPQAKMAEPDRLLNQKIEYIRKRIQTKDGRSVVEQALGTERLREIAAERSYQDLKEITDGIYASIYWLAEFEFHYSIDRLLDHKTLDRLYQALPFKSRQLGSGLYDLCGRGSGFSAVAQGFFDVVMANLDKRILWKPLVDELMSLDELGATSYFFDGQIEEYLQRWDESVALLDEAIAEWGLREFARLVSKASVSIEEGSSFSTTPSGRIFSPSYMNMFPTRDQNIKGIVRSVVHECGHHRWRSFRVNLNPDALRLDLVGARFVGEARSNVGKKAFLVSVQKNGEEKTIEVKSYTDLMEVVKYPKLLAWLHNVADDKRVDALNMDALEGLAEEYQKDIEFILTKRPELKGESLKNLLEALLQQTIAGKTNSEIPEGLREKLEELAEGLSEMEIREETDGTDSLNVALRWYVSLEPEFDELAKKVVDLNGDTEEELLKQLPEDFFGSDTDMGDASLENEEPTRVVLSRRKRGPRFGRRRMDIDPFAFLNLKGEEGDEEGEEGDKEGEEGSRESDDKKEEGNGVNGRKREGSSGEGGKKRHRYNEWTGDGYRPSTKVVVEHSVPGTLVRAPRHLRAQVVRMFKRYAPKTGELVRGLDSGQPDPVLFEQYLERVDAGFVPEPNYFSKVVYERSNVAVQVVLDASGTMADKFTVACEGAAVVVSAASVLKYPIEVGAFTGGDIVDYHLLGATDDGVLVPDIAFGATPMAGAVRHANTRLLDLRRRSRKKFAYQFWVCDGMPNCSGEGINPVIDTSRAVEEGRARGVKVFGIIIGNEEAKRELEKDYRMIFGGGNYVVTTSIDRIVKPLFNFLRRTLHAA